MAALGHHGNSYSNFSNISLRNFNMIFINEFPYNRGFPLEIIWCAKNIPLNF